ncbi:MAG: hypothetical protein LBC99_06645 [Spirochaetota bacterium]|jgi:hypothetical protein|nr:hypothetical protein [Spirochaetota bacterium]
MRRIFEAVKALLPQSRAFALHEEGNIYLFMQALCALPEEIRAEAGLVFLDLFPETSRCSEKWEGVFALYFTRQEEEKRREILKSVWWMRRGGQSAQFLQDVLRLIDNRICVIENTPLSNPRHSSVVYKAVLGNSIMKCGEDQAVCGYREGSDSFVPAIIRNDASEAYTIHNEPDYWGNCFYICERVERDGDGRLLYVLPRRLSAAWRNHIEYIVLKIKPVQSTAIVFIEWVNT